MQLLLTVLLVVMVGYGHSQTTASYYRSLPSGLVNYWTFDNVWYDQMPHNPYLYVSIGRNWQGLLFAYDRTGHVIYALQFISSCAVIRGLTVSWPSSGFTIAAWVNIQSQVTLAPLVNCGFESQNEIAFILNGANGSLFLFECILKVRV